MEEEQTKSQAFENSLNDDDYKYLRTLDNTYLNDFDPQDDTTNFTEQDYANLQRNLVLFKMGIEKQPSISSKHFIEHYILMLILLCCINYHM